MSVKILYKHFENETKSWLADLEKYNDIPFLADRKEWSMSELYSRMYDMCVNQYAIFIREGMKNNTAKKGRKSFMGVVSFFTHRLPASYFKKNFSKSAQYKLADDVKSAKGYVLQCMKVMHALSEEISQADDAKVKIKHEQLGWLTLEEAYAIPEMYFSYYRKAKQKIEQEMIANTK